jgi:hypothetical protein
MVMMVIVANSQGRDGPGPAAGMSSLATDEP